MLNVFPNVGLSKIKRGTREKIGLRNHQFFPVLPNGQNGKVSKFVGMCLEKECTFLKLFNLFSITFSHGKK